MRSTTLFVWVESLKGKGVRFRHSAEPSSVEDRFLCEQYQKSKGTRSRSKKVAVKSFATVLEVDLLTQMKDAARLKNITLREFIESALREYLDEHKDEIQTEIARCVESLVPHLALVPREDPEVNA